MRASPLRLEVAPTLITLQKHRRTSGLCRLSSENRPCSYRNKTLAAVLIPLWWLYENQRAFRCFFLFLFAI